MVVHFVLLQPLLLFVVGLTFPFRLLLALGSRILNVEVPKDQIYSAKFKGIAVCFSLLKAALCGGYVNFGVFRLYGDSALDDALNTFIKLLMSIPQSDLLVNKRKHSSFIPVLRI